MHNPGTKEQKVNKIYAKIPARQKLRCKALYLLHKFTDELSVSREYVKKRAKISQKAKTLEWMHKTQKQITWANHLKKYLSFTPHPIVQLVEYLPQT